MAKKSEVVDGKIEASPGEISGWDINLDTDEVVDEVEVFSGEINDLPVNGVSVPRDEVTEAFEDSLVNLLKVAKSLSGNPAKFDSSDLEYLKHLENISVAAYFGNGLWGRGYKWREFIRNN